jgi:ATP-dependent DNA helicase PIF1
MASMPQEAGLIKTGHQLRQLFASILLNNCPLDPLDLLQRHMHSLSDDCRHCLRTRFHIASPSQEQIDSLCLHELSAFLHRAGKSLSDYQLPTPFIDFDDLHGVPRVIAEELNYDADELIAQWELGYSQANTEKKEVLDSVTSMAQSEGESGLYLIDGPGGTGKTFVENLILAKVRSAEGCCSFRSFIWDCGNSSRRRPYITFPIENPYRRSLRKYMPYTCSKWFGCSFEKNMLDHLG